MFPLLNEVLGNTPHMSIRDLVTTLSQLAEKFVESFPEEPEMSICGCWTPFLWTQMLMTLLSPQLDTQLMGPPADSSLKLKMTKVEFVSFWITVSKEYPCLALRTVKFLLLFARTFLCESGFSTVTTTKTKARNRQMAILKATVRISLSSIPPRLDRLVSQRQTQTSC